MKASVSPSRALELLREEHQAVRNLIDELNNEEMTQPDTIRYGLYPDQALSFQDLLAHLITYEAYALEALDAWRNGEKHWVTDALRDHRESVKIHYNGIDERRGQSLDETIAEWGATRSKLEDEFDAMTEDEWYQPAPYGDESTDLGGMLEEIIVAPPRPMYRHLPVHIPDTNAYIRSLRSGS